MRAYRKIDDHYEVKIEKGRLVVLGVGAGLTLLLVFLVGVLVGKGLWGARPDLVGASSPSTTVQAPVPDSEKPEYTFYEDLKRPDSTAPKVMPRAPGAQEPVGETAVPAPKSAEATSPSPGEPAAPGAGKAGEKPAEPVSKPEPSAISGKMTKLAEGATSAPLGKLVAESKPAETKAPVPKKATEPPRITASDKAAQPAKPQAAKPGESTAGKPALDAKLGAPSYTVQVGSFRDRASADDQAKKIASQAVAVQVVLAPMEGRTWFRVQVGRYDTRAEAESYYQKKLRPKGIQGFVTQR